VPALTPKGSVTVDRLDRQILHGLQIAPRVPFVRLAGVLGVSEQTVARRYQRLRTHGIVRIFGRVDHYRLSSTALWMIRVGCRPGTAGAVAEQLARRGDTSWVTLGAGGAEIRCQLRISGDDREGLLHSLPRAANVASFNAHLVLHRFAGRGEADWIVGGDRLDDGQRRELAGEPEEAPADVRLEDDDRPLLAALLADGRASYAALAEATGWSQRRVALRLGALTAAGWVYFDLDVASLALGFQAVAELYFTVAPADLASVGARLADHPQLAWAGAITGPAAITAIALCPDAASLYRYLTTEVAAIAEVRNCEVQPVLQRYKQAVSLVDGDRLRVTDF
jgi:DNA-binding Lrp family transcriptional regulator